MVLSHTNYLIDESDLGIKVEQNYNNKIQLNVTILYDCYYKTDIINYYQLF